jgi:hypothetical protein
MTLTFNAVYELNQTQSSLFDGQKRLKTMDRRAPRTSCPPGERHGPSTFLTDRGTVHVPIQRAFRLHEILTIGR